MFGPTKITLLLDKTFAIGIIGLVAAACGCIMLKSGLEKFVNGGGSQDRWARIKGLLLTGLATALIIAGIAVIIEPEQAIALFSYHIGTPLFNTLQINL